MGLLDGEESKYVLFIRDQVRGGILLEYMEKEAKNSTVSLKVKANQTKIRAVLAKGKPSIKIDLRTKVDIWEMDSPTNYISEAGQKLLQTRAETALKENILRVISKVQQNYGADIFEFSSQVRSQMPNLWKKMKPNWEQLFKQLKVDVKPEIEIQESGMAMKPFKVGG